MSQTTDMTRGNPIGHLVRFAVPMILANLFQQLYTLVDSAVVGRLIGVSAFAAVGAAGFLHWLVFSVILGLTQGFGVLFAQRFGARDMPGLRRAVGMSVWLSLLLGAALTALGVSLARPVLTAIGTPLDILPDTLLYLRWLLGGTLVTFGYNTAGTVLRALGDSRTPLLGVILASVINVALDILFVATLGMGVEGVAIATVIAQGCALAFCLSRLRGVDAVRLSRADLRPDRATATTLLRLGAPLALRNAVISVGGLVQQQVINGYGTLFIAGTSASRKYFGLMEIIGGALDGAVATYVGQNHGAGRLDRIHEGMRAARRVAVASACAIAAMLLLFGRALVGLLVLGNPAQVAEVTAIGYANLAAMSVCLPALYLLFVHRSALQGMGNALVPMLSGFVELALKLLSVLVLTRWIGRWGVYFYEGLGWIGAATLLMVAYRRTFRRQRHAARTA